MYHVDITLDDVYTGDIPAATLDQILQQREARMHRQQQYLVDGFPCIISFSLNIPGSQKSFPLAARCFSDGCSAIRKALSLAPDAPCSEYHGSTGHEALFPIQADAVQIKKELLQLEQDHPLGRLWDIDVISSDGIPISRQGYGLLPRTCLLCNNPAKLCARSRAHKMEDMFLAVYQQLCNYYAHEVSRCMAAFAARALLDEVSATPKPGLVDLRNTGSHNDMCYGSFIQSAMALHPFFYKFTEIGFFHAKKDDRQIFALLRQIGLCAEEAMFSATQGVNTHKGIVFSMAIICCSYALVLARNIAPMSHDLWSETCASLASHALADFSQTQSENKIPLIHTSKDKDTTGIRIFHESGLSGIRGEAAAGYPHVFYIGYPTLCEQLNAGHSFNDACLITLLTLIAHTDDTNMIRRGGYEEAVKRKKEAADRLVAVQQYTPDDLADLFEKLDNDYIRHHLSPGGCADLLALSVLVWYVQKNN